MRLELWEVDFHLTGELLELASETRALRGKLLPDKSITKARKWILFLPELVCETRDLRGKLLLDKSTTRPSKCD